MTPEEKVRQSTKTMVLNEVRKTSSTASVEKGREQPLLQLSSEIESKSSDERKIGDEGSKEGAVVESEDSARVGSTRLSPDHPCFKYIKEQGLDLGVSKDFRQFTGDPSPLEGKRWYLSVSLLGKVGEFLVDTGASHSFVSHRFYSFMQSQHDNFISKVNACSADGTRMRTYGRTLVPLVIGGKEFIGSPTIADISDDGILGLDFSSLYDAILNPSTGVLTIEYPYKVTVQCMLRQISSVATVVQTVKIPSGTTCDVLIRADGVLKDKSAVVEPDTSYLASMGLESADTLVNNGSWTVIPVSNPGYEVVYLRKGVTIGTVIAAESIVSAINLTSNECFLNSGTTELCPELEKLVQETDLEKKEDKDKLNNLVNRYIKAFALEGEPLGRTDKVLHTINTGEAQPFKMAYRRLPLGKKKIVEEHIESMLENKVIVPSTSPWSSPVQLVTKKDGTIRFCIDYRKLNGVTKKNAYPLPRIDETLDSLGGNEWFCSIDLQSGYWQIAMTEEDKEKTAFSSHLGLYQFELMPFGLCNAPATFEAMMETLLSDYLWTRCLVYLDDVIIFGKTFEECAINLELVLKRIQSNGLKLKPKKCALFKRSMCYLGRIISPEGVMADPKKLETVAGWDTPISPKETKSFMGFCSYYRDFIPGFSRVSQPLQQISTWTPGRKKEPFPWNVEHDRAFKEIKALFRTTPVLRYPNETGHFILDTDASNECIGAALSQIQNGIEVPIAFASNSMNKAQRNYCTTKRELLAVVVYTKKFRHFLYGGNFTLRTDHSSLRWLLSFKDAEGMMGRWLNHLSEFGLENSQIQHRSGVKHINADCLSRKPVRKCDRLNCSDCGAHNAIIAAIDYPRSDSLENILSWSTATLKKFQRADKIINSLLELVPMGICPVRPAVSLENREMRRFLAGFHELEIKDGLLCRWKICPTKQKVLQIVVPCAMRRDIMFYCHGHTTSGHFGKKRSLERLCRRYYWPGMAGELERWVATCPQCCRNKAGPGMGKLPLQQELFGVRFARIALDIISGIKVTPRGNTCMMVVSDYYTKYTKVFPLKNHTAVTCAEAFVKGWVLSLGAPLMMHSDQGREFESQLWSEMCSYLAICKTRTNPYRPQSDGQVERFNRTMVEMMKPLVNEEQDDWDEKCEFVMHAYNNSVNASTNCTPNLLVFGEDIIMPADLVFGVVGISPDVPCTILFVESLRERFKFAYETVRLHLQKSAKWQKVGYDTGLKSRIFRVGDMVMRFHEPLHHIKLASNWDGPFIVVRIVSQTTVVIESSIGRFYKSNVSRLRPWKGRDMPPVTDDDVLPSPSLPVNIPVVVKGLKRGRGRPLGSKGKKGKKPKLVEKNVTRKKNVSADEEGGRRKPIVPATLKVEKAPVNLKVQVTVRKGVRHSPRLLQRSAVT